MIVLALLFATWLASQARPDIVDDVPDISDIQQRLIDMGFEWASIKGVQKQVVIDGVWGEITDRAYCNYKAAQSIEKMSKNK